MINIVNIVQGESKMNENHEQKLKDYQSQVAGMSAAELISWALGQFTSSKLVFASSLSVEDQVITHLLCNATKEPRIITLDTGRLFQETYSAMERTMERYGFRYELLFPDTEEVQSYVRENGPNGFYSSVGLRKKCCEIRKINPLRKALSTADAWVTGLRSSQSVTRTALEPIEWDSVFGLYKINPLHAWSEEDVWAFVKNNSIPYNVLQDRGFRSIGCLPCTRAVSPTDDVRAGRWWWEDPEHKECGLHKKRA